MAPFLPLHRSICSSVVLIALVDPAWCASRSLRVNSEIVDVDTSEEDGDTSDMVTSIGMTAFSGADEYDEAGEVETRRQIGGRLIVAIPKFVDVLGRQSAPTSYLSIASQASLKRNHKFSPWGGDIFAHATNQSHMTPSGNLFEGTTVTDWCVLATAVVILILFDVLFLSKFTDNTRLPEDARRTLRSVFDTCNVQSLGYSNKGELVSALACSEDALALFEIPATSQASAAVEAKLRPMIGNEVSWDDFEAFFLEAIFLSHSATSTDRDLGSMRAHIAILCVWIVVAALYNGLIFLTKGFDAGVQWCSGYILEWLLSVDNLFVFHLIFKAYSTPRALTQKALFIGIIGAVICRMGFFAVMSTLLHMFQWIRIVFGLLLIYSGVQAARGDEGEDDEVADNFVLRCFRSLLGGRLQNRYDMQGRLAVWVGGRWELTLLAPVILCLVVTDVLFALDSVSAKVAQIPNYYIAYSSSVLALFGMRSMFFIIQELVSLFELLKYGLCFILLFIGIELMVAPWVELPASAVLVVIVAIFVVCIAGSAALARRAKCEDAPEKVPAPRINARPQVAG